MYLKGYVNSGCNLLRLAVKLLTLAILASGCSSREGNYYLKNHYQGICNSRAYLQFGLHEYLNKRFFKHSPIRLGIIPFSTPANLAYEGNEFPGVGGELVWNLQRELLSTGAFPIVEVYNRVDWPGKKEEFHTGNHLAIQYARDAGYDFVLVGYVERPETPDEMAAQAKLIETESGTSIWYGVSNVRNKMVDWHQWSPQRLLDWGMDDRRPANVFTNKIVSDLAGCLVANMLSEEQVPQ